MLSGSAPISPPEPPVPNALPCCSRVGKARCTAKVNNATYSPRRRRQGKPTSRPNSAVSPVASTSAASGCIPELSISICEA